MKRLIPFVLLAALGYLAVPHNPVVVQVLAILALIFLAFIILTYMMLMFGLKETLRRNPLALAALATSMKIPYKRPARTPARAR